MGLPRMTVVPGVAPPPTLLQLWRQNIGDVFDVFVEDDGAFSLSMDGFNVGPLVCGPIRTCGQRYQRSRRKVFRSGIDHYLVQLYASGGFQGVAGHADLMVRPGDISVLDLSQPIETAAVASTLMSVMLPRRLLDEALGLEADLGGLVLRGEDGMGALLADYLRSLEQRLPRLGAEDALPATRATVSLIAATLDPRLLRGAAAQEHLQSESVVRMKRWIREQLAREDLTPAEVADRFHLSRASLYRLFAADGGVAGYIRAQRLARCLAALADPRQKGRSVAEIAYAAGFTSVSHFSRLFLRTYGLRPGAVRAPAGDAATAPAWAAVRAAAGPGTAELKVWIRSLGARPAAPAG